eukprot:GEMP01030458.1.p1 GENE.GEMP01030458.1~~GEMP01030458.1.p1  ORF type:complete len:297 (+),score=46.54 GEMP01030458.1:99-989(+)
MVGFQLDVIKLIEEHRYVSLEDIDERVKRAFGPNIDLSTCAVSGSNSYDEKTPIGDQADINEWLNGHTESKDLAIVVDIPEDIIPKTWRAKKEPVLCRGDRIAKYFGEEAVSTRSVIFSLKLFQSGHFRLKQTLSDSGDSYWSIFEGPYEQNTERIVLTCILRYNWTSRGSKTTVLESRLHSSLAFQTGKAFAYCNGMLPAIVGQETYCRVELCREPDKVSKEPSRFCPEDLGEAATRPKPIKRCLTPPRRSLYDDRVSSWPLYLGIALCLFIFSMFGWAIWEREFIKDSAASTEL